MTSSLSFSSAPDSFRPSPYNPWTNINISVRDTTTGELRFMFMQHIPKSGMVIHPTIVTNNGEVLELKWQIPTGCRESLQEKNIHLPTTAIVGQDVAPVMLVKHDSLFQREAVVQIFVLGADTKSASISFQYAYEGQEFLFPQTYHLNFPSSLEKNIILCQ